MIWLGFPEYTGIRLCPLAIIRFIFSLKHGEKHLSVSNSNAIYQRKTQWSVFNGNLGVFHALRSQVCSYETTNYQGTSGVVVWPQLSNKYDIEPRYNHQLTDQALHSHPKKILSWLVSSLELQSLQTFQELQRLLLSRHASTLHLYQPVMMKIMQCQMAG